MDRTVILLSILASDAIAVPLSTGFPIHELKYIMNNSQAGMLVATERYADMAGKIVEGELNRQPILDMRGKIRTGNSGVGAVELEGLDGGSGGMMLYTSGTTNRPVRLLADLADGIVTNVLRPERCVDPAVCARVAGGVVARSMEVQPR
jgi:acyl-coenzyme A synthetase/AMP-(fatty) acid ligase